MNRLKQMRLLAEKTQAEIAKAINIPQNTYSNYENGKSTPDAETLIKLSDYFHSTIDYLLNHEVPYLLDMSMLSEQKKSLIKKIVNTNERLAERTESYLNGLLEAEEEKQQIIQKFKRV